MMFEAAEFDQAVEELNCPKLENWEFFVETSPEGVHCKIYRQYDQASGLYSYKMYGTLECPPETCYQVYIDLEYRKKWDDYVKELYEFTEEENGSTVRGIYWNVNFPFPLSNRDYTFVRDSRKLEVDGVQTYAVLGKSHPFSSRKEVSGVVRVSDFTQSLVLQPDEKGNTKAYMYYFDNPGGMIPTWLINWAAKTGVPRFAGNMRKACLSYEDFLQKRKK
ncbi:phosphatidylcholine transfer protein-like [Dendronephthya gigantea]|uniref:phosphatidylcholine transfer protein-like n=1 Tax=Dendronephthya gigantea TaxID=151771 RepID=UPI0010692E14|nr:phosphatidylcholine transfer protein-like [Dendronephthya gigantea]XP_028393748.1 phosphatidylcholine transfer protein-like [Dendronephthya gigantea]XP_028393757.1 phosphatidylcholine transfer protein-like [Dendronephthya gigantea]